MNSANSPMPLDRFAIYHVRDLTHARSRSRMMFPDIRGFEFLKSEENWLRTNSLHLRGVRVAVVGSSGHQIRLNDELHVGILIPLLGSIQIESRRLRYTASCGEMLIAMPGDRTTLVGRNYLGVVVLVPHEMLARRLGLVDPDARPLRIDRGDKACIGSALRRQIVLLVEELDLSNIHLRSEKLAQSSVNLIVDLLAESIIDGAADRAEPERIGLGAERQVRLAEEFMRANLANPISIGEVAASVGVSARSLQAAFKTCRSSSPKSFLTARRVERVRKMLLEGKPTETVTSILHECGISNPGRFAGDYLARYGEHPSNTLAATRFDRVST